MYIQANKISKNYSDVPLFENLSCTLNMQDKIGLIGQNGTGKTTLLQMLIGSQGVDEGTVSRKKGLSIGYIPQKMAQSLLLTMCIKASKTSKNCKHNSITMKKKCVSQRKIWTIS